jgi:Meckel syndrome type 1 protein
MSKIPQGEWNAIAARYAKGESITRIAQSYGCTPPAIHYILKRSKQRAAQYPEQKVNGKSDSAMTFPGEPRNSTASETPRAVERPGEENGIGRLVASEVRPAAGPRLEPGPAREPVTPMHGDRSPPAFPQRVAGKNSAFTAGLDRELHGRAEAAIAAFRSSFDAALAEGSPDVRHRLRQAASDLMRVAARTTIVLDRLNATAEREPARAPDHARWGR